MGSRTSPFSATHSGLQDRRRKTGPDESRNRVSFSRGAGAVVAGALVVIARFGVVFSAGVLEAIAEGNVRFAEHTTEAIVGDDAGHYAGRVEQSGHAAEAIGEVLGRTLSWSPAGQQLVHLVAE